MRAILSMKETLKLDDTLSKLKVYCKCGHSLVIPVYLDKLLCSHCGYYVYRNKHLEFTNKLNILMKRG